MNASLDSTDLALGVDAGVAVSAGADSATRPHCRFPVIVGHRGAALRAPENTMASFERALADGADALECDVHLSASGSAVVIHDETLDRTVTAASAVRSGAVADLSDGELRTARVGMEGESDVPGEPIPFLEEFLDLRRADSGAPQAYVEVKVASAARAAARLMAQRRPGAGVSDVMISFVPEALAAAREEESQIQRGLIVERVEPRTWGLLEELECAWLSCDIDALAPEDVHLAHARGIRVNVWTVNAAEQCVRALECGVDSISSDDPAWLRATCQRNMAAQS